MRKRTYKSELATLTAIAAEVSRTHNLDEILDDALRTTLQVMSLDAGEIFLVDEETGALTLHAQRGLSDAFVSEEAVIDRGDCLCGESAATQEALVALDLATHPLRSRPACMGEGFKSLICLPLRARGQMMGLMNVQSRMRDHFTPKDHELLGAIGTQIAVALANARLINDAERRRATLDSVMNSLVDGLILVDLRGHITFANPRAGELLALPAEQMIGQTLEALDQTIGSRLEKPDAAPAPLRTIVQKPEDGASLELALAAPACRIVKVRPFLTRSTAGEMLAVGLLLRDMTREKELDEMKSRLLSTVSHELRTPLSSIKGFATTLLREDVTWDESTRREFLSIIDNESDRLSELISNLLDMSRMEAGSLRVEPEPVDLAPIVTETVTEFQVMTAMHQLSTVVPPALPHVWADPRRVRQVLRNLVENAIKYSPEGGSIVIRVEPRPDSLETSVTDSGLGITPQHLDRVFDRFYQADSASTRRVGGAGLGLSICKAIVEAHEGEIWVESQPGVGSTFHFTLPLAR